MEALPLWKTKARTAGALYITPILIRAFYCDKISPICPAKSGVLKSVEQCMHAVLEHWQRKLHALEDIEFAQVPSACSTHKVLV